MVTGSASDAGERARDVLPRSVAVAEHGIGTGVHRGLQLYVSLHGVPVASFGVGEANDTAAMTERTLLPWLCAGKPLLAVAFAQLWERGLVAPDTPVATVLPEFGSNGKHILTFRHLLTHTAGLVPDPVQAVLGAPRSAVFDAICAAALPARARPGRIAHYSRFWAWFLLAETVQRLDGRNYSRYLREEVLGPLGMDDIITDTSPALMAQEAARIGCVYDTSRPGAGIRMDEPRLVGSYQPGIAGLGAAASYGRLLESLLGIGAPVLGPQTAAAVTSAHRVGLHDLHFDNRMSWGLGVAVLGETYGPCCSPRTFGHTGLSTSLLLADPDRRLVIAVIRNGMPTRPVSEERHRALVAAVYDDLGLAGHAAGAPDTEMSSSTAGAAA